MDEHRFRVGQSVYFAPTPGLRPAQGEYRIVHRLPADGGGGYQYRIKSSSEPFERIAHEVQLTLTAFR